MATDRATKPTEPHVATLERVLTAIAPLTIAVSGGVDSMTLATFAHRRLGRHAIRMVHAASPAVPKSAATRVVQLAGSEGWRLDIVDAGEFADPQYRANPLNRCFFCKSNLYRTLSAMSEGIVVSGTNCDDLTDFRPGLEAARLHNVHHPYVDAGMTKANVRALADELGLPEYAALPESPCLSSRIETGLPIEANQLSLIDAVEDWLRRRLAPEIVRCRIRKSGMVIELDSRAMTKLHGAAGNTLLHDLHRDITGPLPGNISIAEYRRGSAFVGGQSNPNEPGT